MLSIDDAARSLRVSPVTVRRRIRAGLLRAYRNGRLVRIREEDLRAMSTRRESIGWGNLSADSFARDWDNPYDAIYDDWKRHGAPKR
jgi:excisionase family DNA binding protein